MMKHTLPLLLLVQVILLVACGSDPAPVAKRSASYVPETTVVVKREALPVFHEAVGTVRARTDVRVEAQITGRVLKVLVNPGDKVKAGDELVILDDRTARARMAQIAQSEQSARNITSSTRNALEAAKAAFDKAKSTYERMQQLFEQKVVTAEEVEQAQSQYLQAKAQYEGALEQVSAAQARGRAAAQQVEEAGVMLEHTTIRAQEDGEVARRLVDPGDLAFPGKELLTLHTGESLRLEALVRESAIGNVRVGDTLDVAVSALSGEDFMDGVVDEIEPLADPKTRSFLVKARLGDLPGLYPGMFGRIRIPLGHRGVLLVPHEAVTRVGQLETVMVRSGDVWQSVFVRSASAPSGMVEILSGLSEGDEVGIGIKAEGE